MNNPYYAPLSARQHDTLMYIADYFWEHGYQPLNTEIAASFGITPPSARNIVTQLESKGYVKRVGKKLYLVYVPGFPHARQMVQPLEAVA